MKETEPPRRMENKSVLVYCDPDLIIKNREIINLPVTAHFFTEKNYIRVKHLENISHKATPPYTHIHLMLSFKIRISTPTTLRNYFYIFSSLFMLASGSILRTVSRDVVLYLSVSTLSGRGAKLDVESCVM